MIFFKSNLYNNLFFYSVWKLRKFCSDEISNKLVTMINKQNVHWYQHFIWAVTWRCFIKKLFFKISQNWQELTHASGRRLFCGTLPGDYLWILRDELDFELFRVNLYFFDPTNLRVCKSCEYFKSFIEKEFLLWSLIINIQKENQFHTFLYSCQTKALVALGSHTFE